MNKTGDVIAIPLPDGRYAFGLQIGEKTAIYSVVADCPDNPPIGHRKFLFATGVYNDVLANTSWPKVGKGDVTPSIIEFVSLGYTYDESADSYYLYSPFFDGYDNLSTRDQCYGLEPCAAWDSVHVIDRIMASLKNQRTEWLSGIPWVPYGIDLTNPDDMRRIPLAEVLK